MEVDQGFSVAVEGVVKEPGSPEITAGVGEEVHFTIQGGHLGVRQPSIEALSDDERDENETLVVDVGDGNKDHVGGLSTTETTYEVDANVSVDDLPEDIREKLLGGEQVKTTVVKVDGEEKELPEGLTVETLEGDALPDDIAKLLPNGEGGAGGGNVKVVELTETILTTVGSDEEYEDGDEEIVQTVIIRKGPDGEDIEEVVTGDNVEELLHQAAPQNAEVSPPEKVNVEPPEDDAVVVDIETSPWTVETSVQEIEVDRKFKVEPEGEFVPGVQDERPESDFAVGHPFHVTESEEIISVAVEPKAESGIEFPEEPKPRPDDHVTVQFGFKPGADSNDAPEEPFGIIEYPTVESQPEDVITVMEQPKAESGIEFPEEPKPHPGDLVTVQIGFKPDSGSNHAPDEPFGIIESPPVESQPEEDRTIVITEVEENLEPFVHVDVEESAPEIETVTEEHYIVHKDKKDDKELTAHLSDITHENEGKVELEVNLKPDEIEEDVVAPVEKPQVESGIDLDEKLGPVTGPTIIGGDIVRKAPPEEEEPRFVIEASVKEVVTYKRKPEPELTVEEEEVPKTEDVMTVVFRRPEAQSESDDEESVPNGDIVVNGVASPKGKVGKPVDVHLKLKTNEPTPKGGKPYTMTLTEEQRRILDSVNMEAERGILDDWVLVKFTPREVQIFIELMRYRPGYLEKSMEHTECCNMM